MGACARNMYSDSAEIKPAQCCIKLVFHLTDCSTCFGWYLHPSSGAHITVSTVSEVNETGTATCGERDWMGTGSSSHPVTLTTGSSTGLNNVRYCRYSDMSS